MIGSRTAGHRRSVAAAAAAAVACSALVGCGGDTGDSRTLNWYINPDNTGSTQEVAAQCSRNSGGRYTIAVSVLPATADGQREQIVRRLAAADPSIDFMTIDPPYNPELASAGWLYEFTEAERAELLTDILESPIETAEWKGKLVGVPYSANTQLLWYRKSVARAAGVDPAAPSFTWDQMIDAAVRTNKIISEQGKRYEGYMVWVNGLIESAGGAIIRDNERGRDATVAIDSPAGREAARIIARLANSTAADPALSTADEEVGRIAFQGANGGFMLNWPYAYASLQGNVADGTTDPSVLDDVAWARYPRVRPDLPSKPPIGGANIGISRFSTKKDLAVEAVKCLISPPMQKIRFLGLGDPVATGSVYDDPDVRKKYPMADLMRESINDAGPRPITPYYGDVSAAVQRTWHTPAGVDPDETPATAARLIDDVLHDRRLL
ncbi:extracellular solute-binding protein [Couchioplanes azureus]|uniref:extracellular solute-binding protein n=1 Tax=Couchioplanes caeruleus TaxID=56438 RepID=UPI001E4BE642|nr:extracellular solute-binding protein [Couchioplanes caeruleus]